MSTLPLLLLNVFVVRTDDDPRSILDVDDRIRDLSWTDVRMASLSERLRDACANAAPLEVPWDVADEAISVVAERLGIAPADQLAYYQARFIRPVEWLLAQGHRFQQQQVSMDRVRFEYELAT